MNALDISPSRKTTPTAVASDLSDPPDDLAKPIDQDLTALYYQAAYLQRVGQFDEARALYAQIQAGLGLDAGGLEKRQGEARARLAAATDWARRRTSAKKVSLSPKSLKQLNYVHDQALARFNAEAFDEAIPFFLEALSIDGNQSAVLANLGTSHLKAGNADEALRYLMSAVRVNPAQVSALNSIGLILLDLGLYREAAEYFDQAVRAQPGYAAGYVNKGAVFEKLLLHDAALKNYDKAIELDGRLFNAYASRANLYMRVKKYEQAIDDFRVLESIQPGSKHLETGVALYELGRFEESMESYDREIAVGKRNGIAWGNKALILQKSGLYHEALSAQQQAIQANPNNALAYWNLSLLLLLIGQFDLGWELYEWRWKRDDFMSRERPVGTPLWLGKEPLQGKTLVIIEEQGLGDMIQFSRYALLAEQQGATVYLEAIRPLAGLLSTLSPTVRILEKGQPLPPHDFYSPMMSLPHAFQTRVETVPSPDSYLGVDEARKAVWHKRLGPSRKLRVGVVWSGRATHANDANRSIVFEQISTLFDVGAEFHCLQKEFREGDLEALSAFPQVKTWHRLLDDFMDTAALASAMDVIVGVDTSVVHLTAAIGRPTWVLLPFDPDFRWLLNREDSPWYSSVRLFRQTRRGDWDGVLQRVRGLLADVTGAPEPAAPIAGETLESGTHAKPMIVDSQTQVEQSSIKPVSIQQTPARQAPATVSCKVCGGEAELYGVVDFNKNCEEAHRFFLPLSGIPVYYHRCNDCGLVFTTQMDHWSSDDFAAHIYNDSYVDVDPDYKGVRPRNFSKLVIDFARRIDARHVLDFGGGEGSLARFLGEDNLHCDNWDPMTTGNAPPSQHAYDLVTCFEVFEHTPTPIETLQLALSCLRDGGLLLFSTLTIDKLAHRNIGFWYIAPRNGHITIHTRTSLARLVGALGWRVHHFSDGMHLAYKNDLPAVVNALNFV